MDLESTRRHWEELARADAMWAAMTWEGKEGRWRTDEFFGTGEGEMRDYQAGLAAAGLPARYRRALDFGCGVGRMAQALCAFCDQVVGVDVSASMLEQARRLNRFPERLELRHNPTSDLSQFAAGSFDLVHTTYVLQHMHPTYALGYLLEFARVLLPGGVLVFQMASDFRIPAPGNPARSAADRILGPGAIAVVELPPRASGNLTLRPFQLGAIPVVVRNAGRNVWPALPGASGGFQVKLASRWRPAGTDRAAPHRDDQRTVLPFDVGPGISLGMAARVCAPAGAGQHTLEIGMLQETPSVSDAAAVRWLADHGGRSCMLSVDVRDTTAAKDAAIEMYCVSRPEITARLAAAGVDVIRSEAGDWAGPDFVSHRYWARKRPAPAR
jgi:SAM-dependent methyltransferase